MKKITLFFFTLVCIYAYSSVVMTTNGQGSDKPEIGPCARYTSDRESCLQCIPYYHLFEGQCYRNIHGCMQYIFGSICQKCETGFILVNNECCDKHCMARIFKNYQEASIVSQETESERIQRLTIEGYEKTVSKMITTVIINSNYQFLSTSNQLLLEIIRYTIKVMINKIVYKAIADFNMNTGQVTILEFRPETEMSKVTETVLSEKEIISNEQAKKAFQLINGQYGLRIYGYSLGQVLVTKYKFGNQYRFIYLNTEKQSVFIFTVVVPSRGNSYTAWMEERKDIAKIQQIIQKNLNLIKIEQIPEFQTIKQEVIKTNHVTTSEITVKSAVKIDQNTFQYDYVNKVTGQMFTEKAKINPTTQKVDVISQKEIVSTDLKEMKLPESPVTKIITKENIPANEQVKQTIRYLEKVQPSLANKQITNVQIQEIGDVHKITLMQKKDDKTTRVVVMKDQKTDKIKLVDESVVEVAPPTKTIVKKTEEGTKNILTNNVENLIKIDKNLETVLQKTKETLPNINFDLIDVAEKKEGNMVNTYTFVVDTEKNKIGNYKHQVVVVQDKQTKNVKVVDVEELETKPIIDLVKRPVTTLPKTDFETYEVKKIIQTLEASKPEFKDQGITVKSVTKEDKKFVNKYEVVVETKQGETVTITANQNLGDNVVKITDVKEIVKPSQTKQKPYIQQVSVDSTTNVKTTVTTNKQEIYKSPVITQTTLEQIKSVDVKPTTSSVVSIKTQEYEKTETTTILIPTKEPQQYLQVVYERPKQSTNVTYVGEKVVTIEENKPLVPVTTTQKINENKFPQIIKTDVVLQKVTKQITKDQPSLVSKAPIDTEITSYDGVKEIVMIYPTTKQQNQRVFIQYNETTQKVTIKQSSKIPTNISPVFLEKDLLPGNSVKIVTNKVQEVTKQDKFAPQVLAQIYEQYPEIEQNLVTIQIVQNPHSNNYVVVSENPVTKDLITVDVVLDKQTEKIDWVDVQEIPECEIPQVKPAPKPTVILETPKQIKQSQVVQNILPEIETVTSQTIKEVTQVKQVKSSVTTTYELKIINSQNKKETVTVLVDNTNPTDITVIDVKPEVTEPAPTPQIIPSKTTYQVDSTNVMTTTTNDKKDFNNYLTVVMKEAQKQQPLLNNQQIICFTQKEFDQNIEIVYLAATQWGNIRVAGFINKNTNKVMIASQPKTFESRLETVDQNSCDESEMVVIKHNSIGLIAQKDKTVQQAVDYILSKMGQTSKIQEITYEVIYQVRIFVIVYEIKTTVMRVVLRFAPDTMFTVIEEPTKVVVKEPTVLEVTTKEDGATVVSTNDVKKIGSYDTVYQEVVKKTAVQYPSITPENVVSVVSTSYPNNNQYVIKVKDSQGVISTVDVIYQKTEQKVIVTEYNPEPSQKVVIKPVPQYRPAIIFPEEQFTSEPVQQIVQKVTTNEKVPVTPFTTEQITSITKVDTPFATNYEITYNTPKGPETVMTTVNEQTKEVKVIDYKPAVIERPVPKPIKTDFYVQPLSGVEVTQTNDIKVIQNSKPIQTIKQTLIDQKIIAPQSTIVETLTKKTETKIQTTIVSKQTKDAPKGIAVVSVYDIETGKTEVIAQKPIDLSPTETIKIGEIFPTTTVSKSVLQEIMPKDQVLKKTITTIVENRPELKEQKPTSVSIDKFGHKTITTVTYREVRTVSVVETDLDTGSTKVIETYKIPQNIKPVVFETEVLDGTVTTITNSVEQITQKEPAMPQIFSEIKVKVPEFMTQSIEGVKLEENNGVEKIYIVSKSGSGENIQITSAYDQTTKKVILMDVRTVTHQEITTQPEEPVKVKLSPQEIKEQKIENIIASTTQITKIPGVKQIVKAEETITGYAKIFDVIVKGTDNKNYIVKTQTTEGKQPTIIDVVPEQQTPKPEIFTQENTDSNTGIIFTRTNNLTTITKDQFYPKWTKYLENQYKVVTNGFEIQSQTTSKLQRTNQYNVRYVKPTTEEAKDYRLTVDRTGKITVLETQNLTSMKSSESLPSEKSSIEIVQSQITEALKKFPVIENSIKILQSADYTYENRLPLKVYLKKYLTITEIILIYASPEDPNTKSRIVLMAETEPGASITGTTKIPKILDISVLPSNLQSTYTKNVYDTYGRTVTISNDINKLNQISEFNKVIQFAKKKLPMIVNAKIEQVEIARFMFANEYTIKMYTGEDDILVVVSVNKNGELTLVDFTVKLPKSSLEKIPIKEVQTVKTVVPVEEYTREDVQNVKQQIMKQFNVNQLTIKDVVVGENQRVNMFALNVETPDKVVKSVVALRDGTDKTVKILETKTVSQPVITQKPESKTITYVEPSTSFVTEKTNDVTLIKTNPTVIQVNEALIKKNVISKTSEIVQTIVKTSEKTVETTILVKQPTKPTQNKAIVTVYDKTTKDVKVIGEQTVPVVKEAPVPTLDKVLQTTVITKEVYPKIQKDNKVIQSVNQEIVKKFPTLIKEVPQTVTQTTLNDTVVSTVTYPTQKIVTTVTTNIVTMISQIITQQTIVKLPEKPVTTSQEVTKQGRVVVTTNNVEQLEKIQPKFTNVITQLTDSYEITPEQIEQIKATETYNGIIYDLLVDQGDDTFSSIQIVTTNDEEEIQINDFVTLTETQILETTQQEQQECYELTPEEIVVDKQVQNVITVVKGSTTVPQVTQVTEVKTKPSKMTTLYQLTTQTPKGEQIVTVTVNHVTKQTTIIDHRPTKPIQQVVVPSVTTVSVDKTTGIKTTSTTNTNTIKTDEIVQRVISEIVTKNPMYSTWQTVSVVRNDFPSDKTVQVVVVMSSGSQTVKFTALYYIQNQTVEILDISTLSAQVDVTKPIVESQVVITKSTWTQATQNRPLLVRAKNYIVEKTSRFNIVPEKVTIDDMESFKRFVFVFIEGGVNYEIIVLYQKSTDTFRIIGDIAQVKPVIPIVLETTVSDTGKTTVVSNNVDEITKVYNNFPTVLQQVQEEIQIVKTEIKHVVIQEITSGEKYTLQVQNPQTVEQIQFIRNDQTDTIKVLDQTFTPKEQIIRPLPQYKTQIKFPEEQFTSEPVQQIVQKVTTNEKVPVTPFTTEQITSITKVDTPFATNYEITYNTPKGPETVMTTVNEQTKEVKVIDYKPAVVEEQPTPEPSFTQVYVEPTNGLRVEETTDVQIIKTNPVTNTVKNVLVKQNIIPTDSEVIETKTTTSETKVTSKMITKSPYEPTAQAIITVYDKETKQVNVVGHKNITLPEDKKPQIDEVFPHTVYTSTIYDQIVKKDKVLPLVISEITSNRPNLVGTKPDEITVDQIEDKVITTVTYKTEKIVTQVVTDLVTKVTEQIDSFTIQEDIKPTILETTVSENGKKTIVSNNYQQISQVKPEIRPALILIKKNVPIKQEQIKTISVTDNQYTIVTMNDKQEVTQVEFVYQPEQEVPITLIDHQEITRPSTFDQPKQIVYEVVEETSPQNTYITEQIKVLNQTNDIIKSNVAQIVKIEKSSSNMVEEYKTQVITPTGKTGNIVIEVENQEPKIVDVIFYTPSEVKEETVEIKETTNPRTDVTETVYPNVQLFEIDEGYNAVTQYLEDETKTHEITSIVKEKYGQNNQYKVLLKSQEHSPVQIDLNINTFNGQVTLMEKKTITSKTTSEQTLTTKVPESKELILSAVEQENVMIISKLSNVKDVEDFDEVKDLKLMEKDEQFVKAVEEVKTMYPSLLSASVIVKILKKDSLDEQQFRIFFNGENNNNIYEAIILINRITNENNIKSFYKIGSSTSEIEQSNLNIGADLAYGYVTLTNYSEDQNIEFILNYLKEHYSTMQNALLQSVDILRLEGRKMNYKLYFKINEENVKYIVFYEEDFQRVLHIRSFAFEIGDTYEAINEERMLVDPYFRTVDKYAKQHHEEIAEGAKVVASEWKIIGVDYSYRTIYHINGKTFHSSIRIDRETQEVQQDYWNEIISIPSSKFDPEFIPDEKAVKLSVSDLNSNNKFSEIHNKVKEVYPEFRDAQLLGAISRSTLSEVSFILYYFLASEYYEIEGTYSVANHKKLIGEIKKVSLTDGYTGVQQGHGSEQVLKWLQKYNPDLSSGIVSELGIKTDLLGTMWNILVKLPTKYTRVIISQQGNAYRILKEFDEINTKDTTPYLKPFPQPKMLISAARI